MTKPLDARGHPPEDVSVFHQLIEVVADMVKLLDEGRVVGVAGLDDQASGLFDGDRWKNFLEADSVQESASQFFGSSIFKTSPAEIREQRYNWVVNQNTGFYQGGGTTVDIVSFAGPGAWYKARNLALRPTGPTLTLPSTVRGWRLGDPINNLTSVGNIPSWSAVRARYWKNEALYYADNYSATNLQRMKQGLAPQRINPNTGRLESMELHHIPAQRDGGLFDVLKVWPDEHATIDPFRHLGN